MARLLVIVPDRISQIIEKGEYQPDYYNPGQIFDEVHILMTNDDRPDAAALQRTVGRARLYLHNYPDDASVARKPFMFLGPSRLRRWAKDGVDIARKIAPDLIRCHGSDWNTYLASRIKARLGVPYVVSLHINPDINPVRRLHHPSSRADDRHNAFYQYLEYEALRNADLVMPVYRPILPYLKRLGIARTEVCYNVLNGRHLRRKTNYALSSPPHLVYVGRLLENDKDPGNIIRAVATMNGVRYTIVGDGPLRTNLEALIASLGVSDRITIVPSIPNDELCELLADCDIFAVHTEYWEVSKSVLEALLTGLPIIINQRVGDPVPEFENAEFVRLVPNTVNDYRVALQDLLEDGASRETLGCRAYAHAQAYWSPERTSAKVVGIYRELLAGRGISIEKSI